MLINCQQKSVISLLIGGWLSLICQSLPAKAQFSHNQELISQRLYSQRYDYEFTAPSSYQYSQDYGRYYVYLNSGDRRLLQRVKARFASDAFVKQLGGRSVIQVGVFNRGYNAQQLAKQLESSYNVNALVVSDTGRSVPDYSYDRRYPEPYPNRWYGNDYARDDSRRRSKFYYVVIPALSGDLSSLQDEIRRSLGYSFRLEVDARNQPRGPHVRVGPFTERSQAERWNDRLREQGFKNARVYYGK
ncbi:MAG: hypothetical protein SAK29_30060 [Scytonema sp. PMC 1069.18]|nr:hypothetical protein [Scytonema sp. PMC 1069.18]MEC4885418.1 hypothetical protein [Scytonema sp. PMC 1070.18]